MNPILFEYLNSRERQKIKGNTNALGVFNEIKIFPTIFDLK
jgi:hypothetical protein